MNRFIRIALVVGPFVCAMSNSAGAKPKSQCAQLTPQGQTACEALKTGDVSLCQWIDMSQSYTASGQRKSYCRTSSKTISKAQYEALMAASGAAKPLPNSTAGN